MKILNPILELVSEKVYTAVLNIDINPFQQG